MPESKTLEEVLKNPKKKALTYEKKLITPVQEQEEPEKPTNDNTNLALRWKDNKICLNTVKTIQYMTNSFQSQTIINFRRLLLSSTPNPFEKIFANPKILLKNYDLNLLQSVSVDTFCSKFKNHVTQQAGKLFNEKDLRHITCLSTALFETLANTPFIYFMVAKDLKLGVKPIIKNIGLSFIPLAIQNYLYWFGTTGNKLDMIDSVFKRVSFAIASTPFNVFANKLLSTEGTKNILESYTQAVTKITLKDLVSTAATRSISSSISSIVFSKEFGQCLLFSLTVALGKFNNLLPPSTSLTNVSAIDKLSGLFASNNNSTNKPYLA
jgi:hypothetical protein